MIELNCKVVKKVATPHFYINPLPLFKFIPPFLAKTVVPHQVIQFLEGPTPPFDRSGARGGGEGAQLAKWGCYFDSNDITHQIFSVLKIKYIYTEL